MTLSEQNDDDDDDDDVRWAFGFCLPGAEAEVGIVIGRRLERTED